MSEWQPIETAPVNTPFLALNHDGEAFIAKKDHHGRLVYRMHQRIEPMRHTWVALADGGHGWVKDPNTDNEESWCSSWTVWTRLYEFLPSHWLALPPPPKGGEQ